MEQIASIEAIARVIQLAVAPVFLLAGIAGLLTMFSGRLGRIIDRARIVENRIPQAQTEAQRQLLHDETATLWRRIRLMSWAIRLCVSGALLICLVIIALFVGEFVSFNIAVVVALLFVAAMVLIVAGLVCLLREIAISAKRMRQGLELALQGVAQKRPDGA